MQAAQNAYNATNTGTPTIVWGSGPTQGNLLILVAFVRDNAGAPVASSGWTILAQSGDSSSTGQHTTVKRCKHKGLRLQQLRRDADRC